jgi:hypothetical protein
MIKNVTYAMMGESTIPMLEKQYDIILENITIKSVIDFKSKKHLGWVLPGGIRVVEHQEALHYAVLYNDL